VGDDPLQRQHHARLLWRLHLLLDHRARGPHHPEPLEDSIIREIEDIRDKVKGFTGTISDLGGPTANMYRLGCKQPEIEAACRKPSCVYPGICQNLTTDHGPLINMYRARARAQGRQEDPDRLGPALRPGRAKSPEYVKELVQHHVGGYLKIAPEHTEPARSPR
jgi:radical SAM superfamily enzyme YgiQ (UPF0313 family)